MKKIAFSVIALSLFIGNAYASNPINGCEIKKQNVQRQLDYAKAHNNHYRVKGLERALSNIEQHCTPEKVVENTRMEILEKQREVEERELELREAQFKDNLNKITKKENKLAEAKAELKELENELELLTKK